MCLNSTFSKSLSPFQYRGGVLYAYVSESYEYSVNKHYFSTFPHTPPLRDCVV